METKNGDGEAEEKEKKSHKNSHGKESLNVSLL